VSERAGGTEPLDWKAFLADFHKTRAGVTEAVLSRARAGDHSPYRWLGRAVSEDARTIVDLASGSGPMSRVLAQPDRTVVGVDLSAEELALAAERGPGPWVQGDALRLPFHDGSVDVVTSSMGLVVVRPLEQLLAEVTRVLRPGGVLAAIAPTVRPLGFRDLQTLGQINRRLRASPRFPGPVEIAGFHRTLGAVGLTRVEDLRERYHFTVRSREDAQLVLSALYLPDTRPSRVVAAAEYLEDRLRDAGSVDVAIPMRRVVAIK